MGESRSELLAWLNDLLNLQYTKVEQCGSGYAYAQIIDSIYGNVPMTKLNPNAKMEYEFINNFKVLQTVFKVNKITKPVPVERLVRCKMQDNLEFLQWIKKYWDTNYPGTPYDPDARRAGAAPAPPPLIGATTVGAARSVGRSSASTAGAGPSGTARRPVGSASSAGAAARARAAPGAAAAAAAAAIPNEQIQVLTEQVDEMKGAVDTLERERDFYFAKLRDIEALINERLTLVEEAAQEGAQPLPEDAEPESAVLKQVQAILYSTEEGFELPEGAEPPLHDEEETF